MRPYLSAVVEVGQGEDRFENTPQTEAELAAIRRSA